MGDLWRTVLWSAIHGISDQNYDQSFAFCRLWLGIGQTYSQNPPGQLFDAIYYNRATSPMDPASSKLIHPTAHLVLRFVNDAESDPILAPSNPGLQNRLCAMILREFFENNLRVVTDTGGRLGELAADQLPADANYIAHWANLGYVEEAAIHDHILQSLISHPILHDHQADALIILFKLAGATFAEYADPSVVNRCFELLKDHYPPGSVKSRLVQEVVKLRERDWEGLHPPPVFTTERLKPTDANQKDSAATPIVTPPGLPNEKLEPQIPRPAPLESVATPEIDTVTASPNTQSSSISIKILSDFTIVDVSDVDLTVITPHETFYLEDGNVEVLCENTLFRVHTSILSFHSPALRRMFAQTNLATAESPNGCPRILTSDIATDFGMLLKTIYLPGSLEKNKTPDFVTFSSLLRITAKYELPAIRCQLLEVVRDGYPETSEAVIPSEPLGEAIFSGPAPHPNEVLSLFVQQGLTSALPMAYYMAARRGPASLMNTRDPASARLPPEILQAATMGLIALREMEIKETHRLIFGLMTFNTCSWLYCPSRNTSDPGMLDARRGVVDNITGSSEPGMKLLQVLSLEDACGGGCHGFCGDCEGRWESGHAEVRKKAWAALPEVFGLRA